MGSRDDIPKGVGHRLSLYLRQLGLMESEGRASFSSRELAGRLSLTAAQVRRDLAYFGQFGSPGVGYQIEPLMLEIRRIMGRDRVWPVVLVGAGNLGRALLRYEGFREQGFDICAVFETDTDVVGSDVDGVTIYPIARLREQVVTKRVKIAILAVPAAAAQPVVEELVAGGIEGILNFAPVSLNVPAHVRVGTVDLTVELEQLAFQLVHRSQRDG